MQKMMRKIWRKKKGFTLIELLIVIAIIGILAGIAIPNFLGARTRARVAKSFADMDAIAKAEEMYFVDNGQYTDTPGQLYPTYVQQSTFTDPWGHSYVIATSSDNTKYLIVGMGPDTDEDNPYKAANGTGSTTIDWSASVRGPIGGSEGADDAYGFQTSDTGEWYDPATGDTGVNSDGDIGYGSG